MCNHRENLWPLSSSKCDVRLAVCRNYVKCSFNRIYIISQSVISVKMSRAQQSRWEKSRKTNIAPRRAVEKCHFIFQQYSYTLLLLIYVCDRYSQSFIADVKFKSANVTHICCEFSPHCGAPFTRKNIYNRHLAPHTTSVIIRPSKCQQHILQGGENFKYFMHV